MTDQFTHRLIYLIGAGQSIEELHGKYIEEHGHTVPHFAPR